MYLVIISLNLP